MALIRLPEIELRFTISGLGVEETDYLIDIVEDFVDAMRGKLKVHKTSLPVTEEPIEWDTTGA